MKLFTCGKCNNLVYFENNVCLSCGHTLGFDADNLEIITLAPGHNNGIYSDLLRNTNYRFCENAAYGTCNWLIPVQYTNTFCIACQLNRTIPALHGQNLERWHRIEEAKHRLVYSLLHFNLPVAPKDAFDNGIAFDFLADVSPEKRVVTSHNNGVITVNIEEADEAERVRNKRDLGEKYRTLLGHFRHEIGHYYWDVLIKNKPYHIRFQQLFGDENMNYNEALKTYYQNGAPTEWSNYFISPYAASHPWEDWAESWSHYMHLMDTLETAYYFGLRINPGQQTSARNIYTEVNQEPYTIRDFRDVVKCWLPLMFAVNSLNRSMGHMDFYPFVIADPVIEKLQFIHDLCMGFTPET